MRRSCYFWRSYQINCRFQIKPVFIRRERPTTSDSSRISACGSPTCYNQIWTGELFLHRNGYNYVELYIWSFRGCLSSKTGSINSFRINILEYFEHQVSTLINKGCMASSFNIYSSTQTKSILLRVIIIINICT